MRSLKKKLFSLDFAFFFIKFSVIKEYAIFAIRNACENNLENQQLIASLTKIKNIKSEIVTEISESVIRIQK